MAIDFLADLDVFFDPDVFGEAIAYTSPGALAPTDAVIIDDRTIVALPMGDTQVLADSHIVHFPRTSTNPVPVQGGQILIVRTGEHFVIMAEPRPSRDGAVYACEVEPDHAPPAP